MQKLFLTLILGLSLLVVAPVGYADETIEPVQLGKLSTYNPRYTYNPWRPPIITRFNLWNGAIYIYSKFSSDGPYFSGSNLTFTLFGNVYSMIGAQWSIKDGSVTLYSGTVEHYWLTSVHYGYLFTHVWGSGYLTLYSEELGYVRMDIGQWDPADEAQTWPVEYYDPFLTPFLGAFAWVVKVDATLIGPDLDESDTSSNAFPAQIELNGDRHVYPTPGQPYEDEGAEMREIIPSATYQSQFEIETEIDPDFDPGNPTAGHYRITYTALGVDAAGNPANPDTVVRQIYVNE